MKDIKAIILAIVIIITLAVMFIAGYGNGVESTQKKERKLYREKLDSVIINHLKK